MLSRLVVSDSLNKRIRMKLTEMAKCAAAIALMTISFAALADGNGPTWKLIGAES